jgi:hypothetical protein
MHQKSTSVYRLLTEKKKTKAIENGFDYVRTGADGASLYRKADSTAATIIGHD